VNLINSKFLLNYQLKNDKTTVINIKNLSTSDNLKSLNDEVKEKLSLINKNLNLMSTPSNKLNPSKSYMLEPNTKMARNKSLNISSNMKELLKNKKTEEQVSNIM
jgi:hypothetical protein